VALIRNGSAEYDNDLPPDELVFTAHGGGPLRSTYFRSRVFLPAAASVGLAGVTPHDLRHTAASLAVAAGANVKAVQRMLGHASAAMTLDVYAGLFGDDLDAVATRLDEAVTGRDKDYLRIGSADAQVVDLRKRRSPGR
jgi:integrase